jgi:hypothetical protein
MREWIMIGVGIFMISAVLTHEAVANENNNMMKACLDKSGYTSDKFDSFNWSAAAGCYHNYKTQRNAEELAELRDFLKHNPRYRFPGQSLNKCFGKPREMPFESAGIETDGSSMRAWVNYKDKLPAGCFETAPWDNRHAKN